MSGNNNNTSSGVCSVHVSSVYDSSHNVYLSDIQLDIPTGSMIALVGGSNSGKALLLKTLNHNYTIN